MSMLSDGAAPRLARVLAETLPDLSRDTALSLALLRLLAQGQPVALTTLAVTLQRPEEAVSQGLARLTNVERDEQGRIVAAVGLSLRPTSHQFTVAGHQLSTWCALDTLIFPALLNTTAQVSSPCPVTGTPIHLSVSSEGIGDLTPPDAVVSLIIPDATAACCDVRGAFCDVVHFFASPEAAAAWATQHLNGREYSILSIADAFALGAELTNRLYSAALRDRGA